MADYKPDGHARANDCDQARAPKHDVFLARCPVFLLLDSIFVRFIQFYHAFKTSR